MPVKSFTLIEAGSAHSFRCYCGCNVFHKRACEEHETEFECNACGQRYDGGPILSAGSQGTDAP